jgi:flagellar protein FliO/FliZ
LNLALRTLPLSVSSDAFTLVFSLLAVVFVLYLCYLFSKFMANRVNNVSKSSNIKVVERVALAQDKGLVIIQVCGKYYLVGFANNNIEILKELDGSELNFPKSALKDSFLEALNSTIKSRWDVKMSDRNDQAAKNTDDAKGEEDKKSQ